MRYSSTAAIQALLCLGAPAPVPDPNHDFRVQGLATPLLLVNALHDPYTPYSWAQRVADELDEHGVLLTSDGRGHINYRQQPPWPRSSAERPAGADTGQQLAPRRHGQAKWRQARPPEWNRRSGRIGPASRGSASAAGTQDGRKGLFSTTSPNEDDGNSRSSQPRQTLGHGCPGARRPGQAVAERSAWPWPGRPYSSKCTQPKSTLLGDCSQCCSKLTVRLWRDAPVRAYSCT